VPDATGEDADLAPGGSTAKPRCFSGAKLVQLRSGLKAQVHAVMAKGGVLPRVTDMFRLARRARRGTR
jgi:hypothetical protein